MPRGLSLLAFAALLLTIPLTARAQADIEPRFLDLTWGSTREEVRARLVERGYTAELDADRDMRFGKSTEHPRIQGFALFTPLNALVKVTVTWVTDDDQCFEFFHRMQQTLAEKYGTSDIEMENYSYPFEKGDGYEQTAVRAGKATIASLWIWPDQVPDDIAGLSLSIEKPLIVSLTYEPPQWGAEAKRRRGEKARDF